MSKSTDIKKNLDHGMNVLTKDFFYLTFFLVKNSSCKINYQKTIKDLYRNLIKAPV